MNRYTVAVSRSLIAQHFLVGGDWGSENIKHSHQYQIEFHLVGDALDQHGYLVDIVEIEKILENVIEYYSDRTLNELPEFQGLNPSIENFSRILCQSINNTIHANNVSQIEVKIWENEIAWSSFSMSR